MAVTVRVPGSLRDVVGGGNKVIAEGATLGEVLDDVERRHPGFRELIVDERGDLKTFVNVYIGDADARASGGLAARVPADSEVMVIPAMAGGAMTEAAPRGPLALPRTIRTTILDHARESAPHEACGLIAAREGRATRVIRCRNVADSPAIRYLIDPREQLAAFRSMDSAGEDLLAIYHSHPASPAFPSPTDRAEAFYPDAVYVLVSLREGPEELRAFHIAADHPGSEKTVREIQVVG